MISAGEVSEAESQGVFGRREGGEVGKIRGRTEADAELGLCRTN